MLTRGRAQRLSKVARAARKAKARVVGQVVAKKRKRMKIGGRTLSKASRAARKAKGKATRLKAAAIEALKDCKKELSGFVRTANAMAKRYDAALRLAAAAITRFEPYSQISLSLPSTDDETLLEDLKAAIETQRENIGEHLEEVGDAEFILFPTVAS